MVREPRGSFIVISISPVSGALSAGGLVSLIPSFTPNVLSRLISSRIPASRFARSPGSRYDRTVSMSYLLYASQ